jgi:hypothetical protein
LTIVWNDGYSSARMGTTSASSEARTDAARGFEAIADAIMYRWTVERDTWVSATEVEQARAYLERAGITTTVLPDGRYLVESEPDDSLGSARLVLLGLRHLHAVRKSRPRA